ncbi:uncharacterized protein LOC127123239 [Lathyrus oleraceus]|uniref:uncharacterized protein LOC127093766 n=1 Tax=Pisum sativum TaxID=3888 RepID=UPI0021D365B0|nr:uncharacterized protein LOC127093766 [Pisum sativum]XP_050890915.1 uncharacterized protein LOC127096381 [Pisum sativum]XP_050907575.1 uncharacterized protein LOC127120999 [Pisum sativum]XP_050909433.1 uncharacterized protein LOC127123239 [Pisum sativum]
MVSYISVNVNHLDVGCEQCGRPSTTKCSRCKSVRYCSTKCLITNWRWHKYNCIAGDVNSAQPETPTGNVELLKNSNEEKENIHSPRPLYLELHPVTTTKEPQVHKTQWEKHLEDELVKSRKENSELRSERDEWKKRASFARERFRSFKEESEKQVVYHIITCASAIESIENFMTAFTCLFLLIVVCVEK